MSVRTHQSTTGTWIATLDDDTGGLLNQAMHFARDTEQAASDDAAKLAKLLLAGESGLSVRELK
jgi:hypothetical protein